MRGRGGGDAKKGEEPRRRPWKRELEMRRGRKEELSAVGGAESCGGKRRKKKGS